MDPGENSGEEGPVEKVKTYRKYRTLATRVAAARLESRVAEDDEVERSVRLARTLGFAETGADCAQCGQLILLDVNCVTVTTFACSGCKEPVHVASCCESSLLHGITNGILSASDDREHHTHHECLYRWLLGCIFPSSIVELTCAYKRPSADLRNLIFNGRYDNIMLDSFCGVLEEKAFFGCFGEYFDASRRAHDQYRCEGIDAFAALACGAIVPRCPRCERVHVMTVQCYSLDISAIHGLSHGKLAKMLTKISKCGLQRALALPRESTPHIVHVLHDIGKDLWTNAIGALERTCNLLQITRAGLYSSILCHEPEDLWPARDMYVQMLGKFISPHTLDILYAVEPNSNTLHSLRRRYQMPEIVQQHMANIHNYYHGADRDEESHVLLNNMLLRLSPDGPLEQQTADPHDLGPGDLRWISLLFLPYMVKNTQISLAVDDYVMDSYYSYRSHATFSDYRLSTSPAPHDDDVGSSSAPPPSKRHRVFIIEGTPATEVTPAEKGACSICLCARADTVFVPCHHLSACVHCTETLMKTRPPRCPICRTPVMKTIKVFTV